MGIYPHEGHGADGNHPERDVHILKYVRMQDQTDEIQFGCRSQHTGEQEEERAGAVGIHADACTEVSVDTCQICANPQRDASTVCVVENIRDVMAVEATQQYRGLYHVLGGVISPMDGVGPSDLQIESLVQRVSEGGIKEVILALSTTMEGDTTNFYIYRKLEKMGVKLSVIARGISVGDELEYADEITLGRSIVNRTLFTGTV